MRNRVGLHYLHMYNYIVFRDKAGLDTCLVLLLIKKYYFCIVIKKRDIMIKPFDEVVILKRIWSVGEIVNDFGTNGIIIFDNSYEIPAMCAHMDDELISTLLRNNSLTLYAVLDSHGCLHVNIDDFNRLKKYLGDKDTNTNDLLNYRCRFNANIDWRCIDYCVREDLKKDFWMKVVNHK